jgi:acyl dehydratase
MTGTAQSALWQDTVTLTIRDLVRYAGASDDFNPIHYEDAFARSIGLPGIIAHGMFSMGIVARLVRQHASGAVRFDRISTRFAGVLLPDHEITITCYPGDDDPGPRSSSYRVDARHTGAANPSVICQVTVTPE